MHCGAWPGTARSRLGGRFQVNRRLAGGSRGGSPWILILPHRAGDHAPVHAQVPEREVLSRHLEQPHAVPGVVAPVGHPDPQHGPVWRQRSGDDDLTSCRGRFVRLEHLETRRLQRVDGRTLDDEHGSDVAGLRRGCQPNVQRAGIHGRRVGYVIPGCVIPRVDNAVPVAPDRDYRGQQRRPQPPGPAGRGTGGGWVGNRSAVAGRTARALSPPAGPSRRPRRRQRGGGSGSV